MSIYTKDEELNHAKIQTESINASSIEKWKAISQIMKEYSFNDRCTEFDNHMLKMQKYLHHIYRLNIYILNKVSHTF